MLHVRAAGTSRQAVILAGVLAFHFGLFLVVRAIKVDWPAATDAGPPDVIEIQPWRPKPEEGPAPPGAWEFGPAKVPEPEPFRWEPVESPPADGGETQAGGGAGSGVIPVPRDVWTRPEIAMDPRRLSALINACYPASSRRTAEEGKARVRVLLGADGRVISWRLLQGTGFARLDAAVTCVLGRLVFSPGSRNGVAVRSEVDLPVVFRLN